MLRVFRLAEFWERFLGFGGQRSRVLEVFRIYRSCRKCQRILVSGHVAQTSSQPQLGTVSL